MDTDEIAIADAYGVPVSEVERLIGALSPMSKLQVVAAEAEAKKTSPT